MREFRAKLRQKNEAAGIVIENNQKRKIHEYGLIDTGRTINSVTHESDENGVIAGTNVSYAVFPALGTRFIDPKPWPTDGLIEAIPELSRVYGS